MHETSKQLELFNSSTDKELRLAMRLYRQVIRYRIKYAIRWRSKWIHR